MSGAMTLANDGPRSFLLVWDLETVPDLAAYARMQGAPGLDASEAEAEMGDKFLKLPLHMIACIGALIAERVEGRWIVRSLGAPHTGERSEAEIIRGFVDRIGELRPQLVSFNGHSFDLPVLRYRALLHSIAAPGLSRRPYFNRYTDDQLDLCDALSSFDGRSKVGLDALCRFLGLPGKPEGIHGGEVASLVKAGRIKEVADYCETDVVNTYRVWLRHELFRGALTPDQFAASEAELQRFLQARVGEHPHLAFLIDPTVSASEEPGAS
jgi:predicted PolB exonuclease-like 3'-5' exonuclease